MQLYKPVLLFTCTTPEEAHIVRGRLESAGIDAFILHEHFAGIMPHYAGVLGSGVQVLVRCKDFEQARDELKTNQPQTAKVLCPQCSSQNVRVGLGHAKAKKIIIMVLSMLIWVPFGNIRSHFICRDCKKVFDN